MNNGGSGRSDNASAAHRSKYVSQQNLQTREYAPVDGIVNSAEFMYASTAEGPRVLASFADPVKSPREFDYWLGWELRQEDRREWNLRCDIDYCRKRCTISLVRKADDVPVANDDWDFPRRVYRYL